MRACVRVHLESSRGNTFNDESNSLLLVKQVQLSSFNEIFLDTFIFVVGVGVGVGAVSRNHGRAPDFFSWGDTGGGKGQGMWGQILVMEGLLMDAWAAITGGGGQLGGGGGGKARARGGGQLPPLPSR